MLCRVQLYDPEVSAAAVRHPNAVGAKSALEAAHGMDALVIMTPWPAFKNLRPGNIAEVLRGRVLIDPYRILDGPEVVAAGLDYFTLGAPPVRGALQGQRAGRHA
jgi:UDPglucose 6-dehydrogenase